MHDEVAAQRHISTRNVQQPYSLFRREMGLFAGHATRFAAVFLVSESYDAFSGQVDGFGAVGAVSPSCETFNDQQQT